MKFLTLFQKDLRNSKYALPPAILLGLPTLLLFQFTRTSLDRSDPSDWLIAYWITFFLGSTSLFYRSFGLEHRNRNFLTYTSLNIPRLLIFLSQALSHAASLVLVGLFYLLFAIIFWSPSNIDFGNLIYLLCLTSLALAPLGTLLGLILQMEREFLFSLTYLPLATPVILGAFSLSLTPSPQWNFVLSAFLLGGGFLSALIFEFFFDELSQSH